MTGRIRIPGLMDVVRLDDPAAIRDLAKDTRLDRDFDGEGPLLNRWITRRIRRTLQVEEGEPLSAVAPRRHPGRAEKQAALEAALERLLSSGGPAPEKLDVLAAYVSGETGDDVLGPAVQEAIGRIFVADYRGTAETWRAACLLDAAPRTINPLRRIGWAITGAVERARRVLSRASRQDPAAVHATAIAVHTLVRSLQEMRALWHQPGARASLTTDGAVTRSLHAPEVVLRRWSAAAATEWGDVRPGTLATFQLDAARSVDPGMVFMTESWSRCPAHRWTAQLLRAVWERAGAIRVK